MKTKHKIMLHIGFLIYLFYPQFVWFFIETSQDKYFYSLLPFDIALTLTQFYVFYLFLLPWLFKYKFKAISVGGVLFAMILVVGFRIGSAFIFERYIIQIPPEKWVLGAKEIFNEIRLVVVITVYSILIRILIDWIENQKQKADLIAQNQTSEIALLRSQINPHFFFNTLNNIYSLVYKKSDDAPNAVMKLSDIMRYMLYDSNTDRVPLQKELSYLNSYIELQILRLKWTDFVQMKIECTDSSAMVAPMMFIPFVENAFKHCSKKQSPGIFIALTCDLKTIKFECINYIQTNGTSEKDVSTGIGLSNVRRRLELIYPDKYMLDIKKEDDKFIVKLEIKYTK